MEADNVLNEVYAERVRQEELKQAGKFLHTCADLSLSYTDKLAVLAEEFGEVAKEVTEMIIARNKIDRGILCNENHEKLVNAHRNLRKELIQVAAVAVAWAESIDP